MVKQMQLDELDSMVVFMLSFILERLLINVTKSIILELLQNSHVSSHHNELIAWIHWSSQ